MSMICILPLYLLMVAGLCDAFDGIFARMYKRTNLQKDFGVQIDSLADLNLIRSISGKDIQSIFFRLYLCFHRFTKFLYLGCNNKIGIF